MKDWLWFDKVEDLKRASGQSMFDPLTPNLPGPCGDLAF